MTDLLHRTACGLYVIGGEAPVGWPNWSWQQPVVDMPGDQEDRDALALIGAEVMGQYGQNRDSDEYLAPVGLAFAALHDGEVDLAEYTNMDFADPDVPGPLVDRDQASHTWTVCGVLEKSWRVTTLRFEADNPLVACFRAWEWCRDMHGDHMLLAAVHEGWQAPLDTFGYADPWISDGDAMQAKARDDWGVTGG